MQLTLPGLLLLIFITLKLCGVIAWSWLWVLSPIWIPIPIFLLLGAVAGIFYAIGEYQESKLDPRDRAALNLRRFMARMRK